MNEHLRRGATSMRGALVAVAAAFLIAAASWHGLAVGLHSPSAAAPAAGSAARAERPTAASPSAVASPVTAGGRDSYADVVEAVSPAVVTVRVEARAAVSQTQLPGDDFFRRFFGDRFESPRRMPAPLRRGLGSGVVVSSDGYILTNHHVIDGAQTIRVDFVDGRVLEATLVGSDPPSDLALLKVEAASLKALPLGDSDQVRVGDLVLAVGNPLGIGQTVTMGIVSAKGRATGLGDGGYEDFLQTDAPINQGNSGGALVSTRGELVGINSQILSPSGGNIGIGFAIPANMARHVMTELRSEGRVRRSQLGVTVQDVTSDLAQSLELKQVGGAIVSAVEKGSAAERAGLERGDVITSINGQPVRDSNTLRNRVAEATPGSTVTLVVVREGRERTLTARLTEAPQRAGTASRRERGEEDPSSLGIAATPLTPQLAARAGLPRDLNGLLVDDVRQDGRAARAGIMAGDVIQEVNRRPVRTVEELRAALHAAADRPALLLINRAGQDLFVTVAGR